MNIEYARTGFSSGVEHRSKVCFVRALIRAETRVPVDPKNRFFRFGRKRDFLLSQRGRRRQNQLAQLLFYRLFVEGFALVKRFAPVVLRELGQEAQGFSR